MALLYIISAFFSMKRHFYRHENTKKKNYIYTDYDDLTQPHWGRQKELGRDTAERKLKAVGLRHIPSMTNPHLVWVGVRVFMLYASVSASKWWKQTQLKQSWLLDFILSSSVCLLSCFPNIDAQRCKHTNSVIIVIIILLIGISIKSTRQLPVYTSELCPDKILSTLVKCVSGKPGFKSRLLH